MQIKIKNEWLKNIFYFLGSALILFVLAEVIWPGSVIYYININYVFVLWVISWLLLL